MEKEPISLNIINYPNILYTMGKPSRCKNGSRKCLGKCYKTIRKTIGTRARKGTKKNKTRKNKTRKTRR
jgi:hypothetical protein